MSEANEVNFTQIEGKRIDCVQSVVRGAGMLLAFTVRFSDGTLLKIDSDDDFGTPTLKVEITHESKYLAESQEIESANPELNRSQSAE